MASLSALPIDTILGELVARLRTEPAVVLSAPPGAGKTSRVPPALLAGGIGAPGSLVMLEPRRLAARTAAARIASEQGWRLGQEVGFHIRFERQACAATRLLIVTEGILVQQLHADPLLAGVGVLVFDEFHERNLASDLALAMARQVQHELRPELRIVVMSATLETGRIAAFLGCGIIESTGRQHPVTVEYHGAPTRGQRDLGLRAPLLGVAPAVRHALSAHPGDILVFLPGWGEIERAAGQLAPLAAAADVRIAPLHGELPGEAQDLALRRGDRRRVVLATNVAETSVTVEGVQIVIDTGLARQLRHDPGLGIDRLELHRISQAATEQRAGRAGREGPGLCLRLWEGWEQAARPPRELAEVARLDLAGPALLLLAWGERDLAGFGWLEPPPPLGLATALEVLRRLGALDDHGVTSLGQILAGLPLHPRLGRLLVEGHRRGVDRDAAMLAAILSERLGGRSRRPPPATVASRSDLLDLLDAAAGPRRDHAHLGRVRDQLLLLSRRALGERTRPAPDREEALLASVAAAYLDRLARRRGRGTERARMVGGRGVRLAAESAVREPELFVAVDVSRGDDAEDLVRVASEARLEWIPAGRLVSLVELAYDEASDRVAAWRRIRLDDLVLSEVELPAPPEATTALLITLAERQLAQIVPFDDPELAAWTARLAALAAWSPELAWPELSPDSPSSVWQELLPALATGRRSLAELRRAPWRDALEGLLTPAQRRALERDAPERLTLANGRSVRLRYRGGEPPILAARIQDLFGVTETPRVAGGRVAVLLHLLAPNQRVQQVTADLAGFWSRTYPEVRKELRARYPRHAWPEDPSRPPPERPRRQR